MVQQQMFVDFFCTSFVAKSFKDTEACTVALESWAPLKHLTFWKSLGLTRKPAEKDEGEKNVLPFPQHIALNNKVEPQWQLLKGLTALHGNFIVKRVPGEGSKLC